MNRTRTTPSSVVAETGSIDSRSSTIADSPLTDLGGSVSSRSDYDYTYVTGGKTFSDVVTPRFRERIKKGEIIANPFSSVESHVTGTGVTVDVTATRRYYTQTSSTDRKSIASGDTTSRGLYYVGPGGNPEKPLSEGKTPNAVTARVGTRVYAEVSSRTSRYIPIGVLLDSGVALPPNTTDALASVRGQAIARAFAKVHAGDMQSLVTAAELPKTIKMVQQNLRSALKILKSFKKWDLKFLKGSISSKTLASKWLEYRYGIMPLVYDLQDLVKSINSIRSGSQQLRKTFRASATAEARGSTPRTLPVQGPGGSLTLTLESIQLASVSARATVLVGFTDSKGSGNISRILGGFDFISSAWELVPFSFVVDWFVNVGDWVASWQPMVASKVLTSCVTTQVVQLDTHIFNGSTATASPTSPSIPTTRSWTAPSYGPPAPATRASYRSVSSTDGWMYEYTHGNFRWATLDGGPWTADGSTVVQQDVSGSLVLRSSSRNRVINPDIPPLPFVRLKLNVKRVADAAALIKQTCGHK